MICLGLVGTTFGMIQPAPCFPPKGYPGQDHLQDANKSVRSVKGYNPMSTPSLLNNGNKAASAANSQVKAAEEMDKQAYRIVDEMSK